MIYPVSNPPTETPRFILVDNVRDEERDGEHRLNVEELKIVPIVPNPNDQLGSDTAYLSVVPDDESYIEELNDSIRIRQENMREYLIQRYRAGRILSAMRPNYGYGEWTPFLTELVDKTHYDHIREVQLDMQLWASFADIIADEIRSGQITNVDAPEREFVALFAGEEINYCMASIMELVRKDANNLARKTAIELMSEGNYLSQSDVKRLRRATTTAERVPERGGARKFAVEMVTEYGVRNEAVIKLAPQLVEHPAVVNEIRDTRGYVYVPTLQKQVALSDVSESDILIAIGNEDAEAQIQKHQNKIEYGDFLSTNGAHVRGNGTNADTDAGADFDGNGSVMEEGAGGIVHDNGAVGGRQGAVGGSYQEGEWNFEQTLRGSSFEAIRRRFYEAMRQAERDGKEIRLVIYTR